MEYVLLKLGTTTDYFADTYYLCFPTFTHRLIESSYLLEFNFPKQLHTYINWLYIYIWTLSLCSPFR